jgi:hypothetical protein
MSEKKPSRLKYLIPAVIIILCIPAGLIYRAMTWTHGDSESQKQSETIIRQAASRLLNKSSDKLTDEDFAKIEIFTPGTDWIFQNGNWEIYTRGVSDLSLLEKFINLRELTLTSLEIPENALPKWIKMLGKYNFNIRQRYLIDLSPLAKLPKLSRLNLSNTSFEDIDTITGIKNLHELDISNTKVSDLKPIKKFKQLNYLDIGKCVNITDQQVEDLQKALPNLRIER